MENVEKVKKEKKPVVRDKPRIVSTVILGVILTILLVLALSCVGISWSTINSEDSNPAAIFAVVFAAAILIVLMFLVYGVVAIASGICLIFTIKNRKSIYKPVRIISYVMDGVVGALIILSVIKIVLLALGI